MSEPEKESVKQSEVPGPELPSDAPWLKQAKGDSDAVREELKWKELDPRRGAHNEVYRLTIKALRFGAWILGALVLVRLWHLAGPYQWGDAKLRWLSVEDINAIDKMLFSGALGGLVLGHLKEIMKPLDK
ncbi:hypothetical protein ABMZ67_10170 [Pseudomonas aeruginosa]|uniref:hypothetical protein n=1 Tax=Pseudomonas TaxID=286 RepID=UPI00044D2F1F|nr:MULTISPECIES: hypothetical protein [Pseudomonas]ALZ16690.1 hypothetical protein HV98_29805 [Pseudomonas aeruginosa]EJS3849110.1 hypothetical protein [Pseudomonas aeruginosa]EKA7887144.1 hypothetical protein [Pseudomonas aeruginosa]EKJ7673326.1 hypothetical protein [Pseudomonas aeruginosa]EKU0812303.1 hypothetical protein [Pseudomonas aeruginosa]